jgi:hypothetical protein
MYLHMLVEKSGNPELNHLQSYTIDVTFCSKYQFQLSNKTVRELSAEDSGFYDWAEFLFDVLDSHAG